MSDHEKVVIGRINGVHGLKGWVKVFSYTQPRTNICHYSPWLVNNQEIAVETAQVHGKGIIAKLATCDDCDTASRLVGAKLSILRSQFLPLSVDDYYWRDLIGLRVINRDGCALGLVKTLVETGAHDVLVINDGEQERLIPFVPGHCIDQVDLVTGVIQVDWGVDF